MPARQPFTTLCRTAARGPRSGLADLHVHTLHSDGAYTPVQIVDLARRSGLAAVAITDHDTLVGVAPAQQAALGSGVAIVPGVEITAEFAGRELHLLAYFVRLDHTPLQAALARLRQHRAERFSEMVRRLRARGVPLDEAAPGHHPEYNALGRRHLAALLVSAGRARTVREAFTHYLGETGSAAVPKLRLPVAEAIALVREAGGAACWAHPRGQCTRATLAELRDCGLHALEVRYPGYRSVQTRELSTWAAELNLAVTAGSDCHGPGHPSRAVGACTVNAAELEQVRARAGR